MRKVKRVDVVLQGNEGEYLFFDHHDDIDWSDVRITVTSGRIFWQLRTRVWYTWETRNGHQGELGAGESVAVRSVPSTKYDGDTELSISSLANNTSVHLLYVSVDD